MPTLNQLAGGVLPLPIGDYEFSPLTIADLGVFRDWVAAGPLRLLNTALEDVTDTTLRQSMIDRAYRAIESLQRDDKRDERGLSRLDQLAEKEMQSPGGIAYLIYLSVKAKNPAVKQKDIAPLLAIGNMQHLQELATRISGLDPTIGLNSPAAAAPVQANGVRG